MLSVCGSVVCHFLGPCQRLQRTSGNTNDHPEQTSNRGQWKEELLAKGVVKTKTVSAEPLAFEDPSAGGWAG
jgi:hypothetical protein